MNDCEFCVMSHDLHSYIPVGVLETIPQKINERPPTFMGRDDLETMMASNNCKDWIKIRWIVGQVCRKVYSPLPFY